MNSFFFSIQSSFSETCTGGNLAFCATSDRKEMSTLNFVTHLNVPKKLTMVLLVTSSNLFSNLAKKLHCISDKLER